MNNILKIALTLAVGIVLAGCYNDFDNPAPAKVYTDKDFTETGAEIISIKDLKAKFYEKWGHDANGLGRRVVIEDDVEIGANTCIDRAKTDSTVIRRGVKLDNLIQIGHNVQIGENTVSSAQTGIAGTSKVGRNCFLAGQVGIADHVTIGDRVKVGSKSGLDKDVPDDEIRFGYPALPGMQYHRSAAVFKRLPELAQQVRALEKQLAELTKK